VLFKPDQSTPLEQLGIERGYEALELPLLKRVVALSLCLAHLERSCAGEGADEAGGALSTGRC
jgi:hypothetical protein